MPRQVVKREDVVWAAGLFEGEGCLTWHRTCANSERLRFAIQIGMNDRDVLDKFESVFRLGKVRGPYKDGLGRRLAWQYQCSIPEQVYAIAMMLFPFLGKRRQAKVKEFVELFKKHKRRVNRYA